MQFSNDLGYSSVKAYLYDQEEKFPSAIARVNSANDYEPITFTDKAHEEVYMQNFMNHLFVSISSNAVSLQGKYLVGTSAATSSLTMIKFDVNDFSGKSESDLSPYLSLATIAGKAVQDSYMREGHLPDSLEVTVYMTTALPVSEGKTKGVAEKYRNRYLNSKHVVTINNFEDPITVAIKFKRVYVGLEGELAQLAIANADNVLETTISDYLKVNYPKIYESMSIKEFLGLKDVMGIDIGGGTVDVVPIIDGVANANASDSLKYGFGNVLQEAVAILQNHKINFEDRTALQEYLLTKPNPITQDKYDFVHQVVMEAAKQFIDKIVEMVSQSLRKAGANISVVYVYGGGANALVDSTLKQKLVDKLKEFNGGFEIPIVWIGKSKAQNLNVDGLKIVNKTLFSEEVA